MKLKSLFMAMTVAFAMTACSDGSDKEVEKEIAGTYQCNYEITEDGIDMEISGEVTYNEDNTCECSITCRMDVFDDEWFNASCTGTWTATADQIVEKIDESSIKCIFSRSFLDLMEMDEDEATAEMLKGIKSDGLKTKNKILYRDSTTLCVDEDGDEVTYHRVM